jgi:hypothetical protein
MSGETLGRFEIQDKLGEGGMGVLYRARDTRLGRTVAIKLLRPEAVADPERTRRFLQEARAAGSLNHPNIVTVHDIGEDPERGTWIAMECLEGESLRQRLARGPLAVPDALRIAVDMARGLAAAHAAGIVHRDVKPANVMITSAGLVKVLDFGLAKLAPAVGPVADSVSPTMSASVATAQGAFLGTPAYMSPEQAEGRAADARSDIFSLGAVLYEMLTGKRPFEGASGASLLSAILRDTPKAMRSLRPELDAGLEKVVSRCLEKDPGARYPSAPALLSDLEACQVRESDAHGSRSVRRRAWRAGLGLVLVGIVSFGVWFWRRVAHERWARREALPEIQRLTESDQIMDAFRLAERVRPVLAGDPDFDKLWLDLGGNGPLSLRTEPPGAEVSVKPYLGSDSDWRKLGPTPLEKVVLPRVYSRFRIEKPGYSPVELAFLPFALSRQPPFRLVLQEKAPSGDGPGTRQPLQVPQRARDRPACVLARPLRGDEPAVRRVREGRRLRAARALERTLRKARKEAVLG